MSECGVLGHDQGHWVDPVIGLWWCPDCRTETYVGPDEEEPR